MPSSRECYVYIQLPGTMETVTCGRYVREPVRGGGVVGRFVYGRSYRARPDAQPIDPVHLPLSDRVFETTRLEGVFGAIRDSSPDAWGRRVIERAMKRIDLDELDYLLYSPEDRAGALSFGESVAPPAPVWEFNRIVHLAELREAARQIEAGAGEAEIADLIARLVHPTTSMGGARAKSVVEDEDGLWIAKFPERADRWSNAPVEAAMLRLAAQCGIAAPETRIMKIGNEQILLVRRFDRERVAGGYLRHRMVSALTVFDADESVTERGRWSYLLLADEVQRWSTRPREDRAELFRRMVLNALISNSDDHPRNHALIAPGAGWRLSPVYDLTPRPSVAQDRELAMICGPAGRLARRANLVGAAPRFGLSSSVAEAIVDEIARVVTAGWRDEVRAQGGSLADCDAIASAFVHPGFEYPIS
jgi:serine/threonine-protein kinase HipA